MKPKHQWLHLLQSKWHQQMAFSTGRDLTEDITNSESSACANVCSIYNIMRGAIARAYAQTGPLSEALWKAGYTTRYESNDWRKILPGDIAFSEDRNPRNGMPDHVFIIFDTPTSDGKCLVLDNYEPYPHLRNLLEGPQTPLAYFLRSDEQPVKRLTAWQQRIAMIGFSCLYTVFSSLPPYIQRDLNALRHDPFFTNKELS